MDPFAGPAAFVPAGAGFADTLDEAPIGALILDESWNILYRNGRIAEILGAEGEALRDAVAALMEGPVLARASDGGTVIVDAHRPDGGTRTLQMSFGTVAHGAGDAMIVWIYDVTDLHRAREEAERAARNRSGFLATMSHEIRTPMNGVATIADLLAGTPLDADQRDMVRTIRASAGSLLAILDDVLDYSKIEAGGMETEDRPYSPAAVVEGMAAILRPRAAGKGLDLTVAVDSAVPPGVRGDGARVRQVLINLVGNAIKFTERGGVSIRVSVPAPGRLRFEVEDTGIGIPGDRQAALFRPFVQVDAGIARRFGGSGLGLSICRGLVELMDGTIGLSSAPDAGSLFWFEIAAPVCAVPPPDPGDDDGPGVGAWTAPSRAEAEARRAVVLCVEDNPTNRFVLERVLARLGIVHDMAEDGTQALAMLRPDRHGLVLSDLHMPGLDGYGLARAIRARAGDTGPPPVVALSADFLAQTAEACRAAGMVEHLGKPIRIDALDAAIGRHLPVAHRLRRPAEPAESPIGTAAGTPAVIDLACLTELVGDDPAVVRDALESFVASAGDQVAAVERGAAGPAHGALAAAHSLKSAALCVGAGALSELAGALESALRTGDADAAATLVPRLRAAYDACVRAVRAPERP
ncbi:ATP-binding protein [Azospirillum halopraeferens]|uniref:ATP-binding protein n=1 Tax=Azospirillum halopraeferens TaxID=34010 RepID=UPI0004162443|nr:ATP-binding protein [Azospirillum halopraeferens]